MRGPQDASFPELNASLLQAERVIKRDPAVQNVMGFTGGGGATNTGNLFVILKPLNQRPPNSSAAQVINRLRPGLNRITAASTFLQASQDLRIGGRGSNAMYQYTIQADNVDDLQTWGPKLLAAMTKLPGFQDVSSDQQNGGLDQLLTYDRVEAARLGQTASSLDSALYADFGQSQVSLIYTQLNQYYVVLEVAPQYWATPDGLKDVYLHPSPTNPTVTGNTPLLTMAKVQANTTPLQLNHTGLFPSVTVSFNLAPGVALSDATLAISQMQEKLGTPSTVRGFFAGTLQAYQQSLSNEWMLVITALLAVYIVLGILYESLVHPLTIISTLPSASVGAMLSLMMFKQDLNVISIIGIVLLIGIVKKNAIMMIDFALQAEREGGMNTRDCDLRGMHAALPAHHDDDDGGAVWRAPAGLWDRHRIGTAPAAGHHHRRRTGGQPDADALHHTGGLPCAGQVAPAGDGTETRHFQPRAADRFRPRRIKIDEARNAPTMNTLNIPSPSWNHCHAGGTAADRLHGRAQVPEAARDGAGSSGHVQGVAHAACRRGHVEGGAAAGCDVAWQLVGDL